LALTPPRCLPNGNGRRAQVNRLATPILRFRNRIAHHEAIFSLDLDKQFGRQLELAQLIDEDARHYIQGLSRIDRLLQQKP